MELGGGRDAAERAFRDLCGRLVNPHEFDDSGAAIPSRDLRGRAGILLFGRERMDWRRYDRRATPNPWSNYIDSRN